MKVTCKKDEAQAQMLKDVTSKEIFLKRSITRAIGIDLVRLAYVVSIGVAGFAVAGCGGNSNDGGATDTPAFTPTAGSYSSSQTVTVSDTMQDAVLYCTMDGSAPSASSRPCPEPITVAKSETIRALAIAPGHKASSIATATYQINLPKAAEPTFSPAAGTYVSAQAVTISDATPGALIYYTTDGSAPSTSSILYTGPVAVTGSETLKAIAVLAGYSNSDEGSAVYLIQLPAPTPVISTSTGSNNTVYGTPFTVTISDADANATIYYAIGTAATTASTQYTGPISISSPGTINAIAVDSGHGFSQSAEASVALTVTEAAPSFTPKAGTIHYASQVAISDADPNATIYYSLGGSPVTTSSTVYAGPITLTSSETINAIAVNTASGYLASATGTAAYVMPSPTAAPAISTTGGATTATYPSVFTVSISDTAPGADIYYTTDGSTPSPSHGTRFSGSFAVAQTETVSAMAIDDSQGAPPSAVVSQLLTVQEAAPVISPAAGAVVSGAHVTITDQDPGAAIYYTTNGSAASTSSSRYTGPISITSAETINAIAINTGTGTNYTASTNVSAAYTIQQPAPAPVITPAGGSTSATYPNTVSVSITDSDSTASIYYTLDGSVPSETNGTKYTSAFKVTSTETVSAVAIDPTHGYGNSAVISQAFTIVEATPVITPPAGTVSSGTKVTITDADPGASIYYTTNGSAATTSSSRYTVPVTVTTSEVIHAVAANNSPGTIYSQSADVSASYHVPGTVPPPTIGAAGGTTTITYPGTFSVSLSDSDSSASIYYTTDGSTPSATNGTKYTAAFVVSSTLTVSAIAIDTTMGTPSSAASSQLFTVVEAKPVIAPASGVVSPGAQVTITDVDPGATIYYTTNGLAATTASGTKYTGPITINSTTTVNAVAANAAAGKNYAQSAEASASYTVVSAPATPVISTAGDETSATYPASISVTIMDTDASASIYYTEDGTIPSKSNGTHYSGAFTVDSTKTIKAVAVDSAYADGSAVASTAITIIEAEPKFTPAAGLISPGAKVTITDQDAGATIYYTTDGSAATTSSTRYSGPITISSATTIHAAAINTNSGSKRGLSAQASAAYTPYSGRTISGAVGSGSTPIIGATIQLYAAGTTSYASGAAALTTTPSSVVTDLSGGFSFGYQCPAAPGDQLYLVTSGGSTVAGKSNASIALMATLGTCSQLGTNTSAAVNELTTVASAYSLSGFAAAGSGGGIDVGAPAPSATCSSTGKSTCNYRGLANAFLTPGNLVDPGTGAARTVTPFYSGLDPRNPNGWSSSYGDPSKPCPGSTCLSPNNPVPARGLNTSTAPYQRVNTLGNVLASCVLESSNCDALVALTGDAKDTLGAALYIAQHPFAWSGTTGLYELIERPSAHFTSPYGSASSTLNTEPNDWALAISITGAGLGQGPADANNYVLDQGLAIDADGNVWITGMSTTFVINPPCPTCSSRRKARPNGITGSGSWTGMIAGFDTIGEALTAPTSLVKGTLAYDASNGHSSYGGFGPNVQSANGLGGAFLNPYSFLIDASGQIWVNINVSSNHSTSDVGPAGGAKVTISNPAVPGATNLTLSSNSPDGNYPSVPYSVQLDSSGKFWGTGDGGFFAPLNAWDSGGKPLNQPGFGWYFSFNPSLTFANTLCNMLFDTNGTMWGDNCAIAGDLANGQVFAVSQPDTSDPNASANVLGDYKGAATLASPTGTLAAGAGGSVYACDITSKQYMVLNTSHLSVDGSGYTLPVTTFKPPMQRCGQFVTVDGDGHIWSYTQNTANGPVLDEIDSSGNQITPNTGLTGTSSEEVSAVGLTLFNNTALNGTGDGAGGQQGGMAVDGSGNLWFLNGYPGPWGGTGTPANALVEIIGVAAPTVTPAAVATQNGAQGSKP
jgi:hypothetical protein